jgi:hypothetical protein
MASAKAVSGSSTGRRMFETFSGMGPIGGSREGTARLLFYLRTDVRDQHRRLSEAN